MRDRTALPEGPWLKLDLRLHHFVMALMLPVIVLQSVHSPTHWKSDPVLWLSTFLLLLCAIEWLLTAFQKGVPYAHQLVPLLIQALAIVALWFDHPIVVMGFPLTIYLIFMYFPLRQAQKIALAALGMAVTILYAHWQVGHLFLVPTVLLGIANFYMLSLFCETNAALATELRQTNQQLTVVLEDYGNLRQRELERMREHMVDALIELSRHRDSETGRHIMRTQLLVERLAHAVVRGGHYESALTPENITEIVKAAPMHDLGKIGVPDHVLSKPGRLTPEETQQMQAHCSIGEASLLVAARQSESAEHDLLRVAARIAAAHHENWDGSGYPRGLAGEKIPLEARLMAVADVYDALTTPRIYKNAWSHEAACAEIVRQRNVKFDPVIVDAFVRESEAVREIAARYRDLNRQEA